MKYAKLISIFLFVFCIVGCCAKHDPCSKSSIVYTVVTYDKNELVANNKAMAKIMGICCKHDLQAKLIDYHSRYMGYDDKQKRLIAIAHYDLGSKAELQTHRDYQVMAKFRCVTPPLSPEQAVIVAKQRADEAKNADAD